MAITPDIFSIDTNLLDEIGNFLGDIDPGLGNLLNDLRDRYTIDDVINQIVANPNDFINDLQNGVDDLLKDNLFNDDLFNHAASTQTGTNGDDTLTGTSGRDRLNGLDGNDTLTGLGSNDILSGDNGNDTLYGNGGNDLLLGGSGIDRLVGGHGLDVLAGGRGNDFLTGGIGNDRLAAGIGRDVLAGGAGEDWFILEQGAGRAVIRDFQKGQDKLGLAATLEFTDLTLTQQGSSTIVSAGTDLLAILRGVNATQLTPSDVITPGTIGNIG